MKPIEPHQLTQLQTICSGKFSSREERLEAVGDIVGTEINSFKELSQTEADELIRFFNTGKIPANYAWATFDFKNKQHLAILSVCHTLGWVQEENPQLVDLHRLGGWLKHKSPINKPLKEMETKELSKLIFALEQIIKKQFIK